MDTQFKKLQDEYKQVPIPEELDLIVNRALRNGRKKRIPSKWLVGVSAAALIFVIGINTSTTVANAFSAIPGVESIVKVLTFKEYKFVEPNYNADVKIPAITNLDNKALELELNEKYLKENKQLYDQFQTEIEALKKDGDGHLGLDTGYEVVTDNDQLLSIGRYVVNTVGSSSTTMKYDTIDKKNQLLLSLPMLFKDDRYVRIISDNIKEQMRARIKEDPNKIYWVVTEDNQNPIEEFMSIKKDQSFYINNEGQLVISFDKYEVAPGYMGLVKFVIPTDVLADILVSHNYVK